MLLASCYDLFMLARSALHNPVYNTSIDVTKIYYIGSYVMEDITESSVTVAVSKASPPARIMILSLILL